MNTFTKALFALFFFAIFAGSCITKLQGMNSENKTELLDVMKKKEWLDLFLENKLKSHPSIVNKLTPEELRVISRLSAEDFLKIRKEMFRKEPESYWTKIKRYCTPTCGGTARFIITLIVIARTIDTLYKVDALNK